MITIRPATQNDYDFLWQLHRATMRAPVEKTWGWDEALQSEYFRKKFDPHRTQVIEFDGAPVGQLTVERLPEVIYLGTIEISPTYQRQGIGTSLIGDLCAEAGRLGIPVELRVIKANPAAGFYERLGFKVFSEIDTHRYMRWAPPVS